jgi:hypothetical protein
MKFFASHKVVTQFKLIYLQQKKKFHTPNCEEFGFHVKNALQQERSCDTMPHSVIAPKIYFFYSFLFYIIDKLDSMQFGDIPLNPPFPFFCRPTVPNPFELSLAP